MSDSSHDRGSRHWLSGYPELVAQWNAERNGTLAPENVSAGSGRLIWWRCAAGPDHVWRAKPNNRTRGTGCPFCANKRVSKTNNLAVCFPWIAAEWHPLKNGCITPGEVVAVSTRLAFWSCSARRDHEWRASIRDRTRGQTTCPFCTHKRVPIEDSLALRHPDIAYEWHPSKNGDLRPRDVSPGSSRAVFWQCSAEPNHEWRAIVANRVRRASGCPHCAGRGFAACA
jgi:hypothetical protein